MYQVFNFPDVPLVCDDGKPVKAHHLILAFYSGDWGINPTHQSQVMLHTNAAELRLLFDTFTRVWTSGGQANLSLQTKDSQTWAKLDLQLGPAAGRRPGPPEAGGRAEAQPWSHQEQPHRPPHHHPQVRRRGPAARARDEHRRQVWLAKRQESAQENEDSQTVQESVSSPQQEDQEIILVSAATKTESEAASDKNTDVIPQLDGAVMTVQSDKPDNEVSDVKEESPVIFKMLENGFAETKQIPAGETPPATVFHPELRIGRNPIWTEWKDKVWIEYDFEVDNVRMEMYQVI